MTRRPRSPPPQSRAARPRAGGIGRVGDCGGEAASRYLVFKFRLTDGRMAAQLPSVLEGDDAQAAQPTAAEQSSPPPRGTIWPDRGTVAGETASQYMSQYI